MRLPWGSLRDIATTFLSDVDYAVLGCLSSEERCCAVPKWLYSFSDNCLAVELLEIIDPSDAYPDHSIEAKQMIEQNRQRLKDVGVNFQSSESDLIAFEDQLLEILNRCRGPELSSTLILDITSLPKRYFCFFLKRMLKFSKFRNVIVTYTQAGSNGYTHGNLAEDPMTGEHLPGFAASLPPENKTFVISVGFESLNMRSLLETYQDPKKGTKMILPFPPDGESIRRVWRTLKQIALDDPQNINRDKLEVIAVWDTEQVYQTLNLWNQDAEGLTLAPFGPKPHSLGMALFAIEHDSGLYYTQPKSYNPKYSKGIGGTWAYVVKWDGIPCFDRTLNVI